jgi:Uma2 family endonuclease
LTGLPVTNYTFTMALPASIMVTADDYRCLPEGGRRYQLIDGELVRSPAPDRYHQDLFPALIIECEEVFES